MQAFSTDNIWEKPAPKLSGFDRFRLQETCHHEGSHVVAAHQLGIPLSKVSVEPGADSLGHTELKNRATAFDPTTKSPAEAEEWARNHGIVCLAGAAGSFLFSGDANWKGASADLDALDTILRHVAPSQFERKVRRNRLWEETQGIVQQDWALVEAVAAALQSERTLDSKRVREVIERAKKGQQQR